MTFCLISVCVAGTIKSRAGGNDLCVPCAAKVRKIPEICEDLTDLPIEYRLDPAMLYPPDEAVIVHAGAKVVCTCGMADMQNAPQNHCVGA
jgi:hypothetical protein